MAELIRENMGLVSASIGENGLRVKMVGLVGTQSLAAALRRIPGTMGLEEFTGSQVEEVVGGFKGVWGEMDKILELGGAASSDGKLAVLSGAFKDEVNTGNRGFWKTQADSVVPIRSALEGDVFTGAVDIFVMAPNLGNRIRGIRIPGRKGFSGHQISIAQDSYARNSFLQGLEGGLAARMRDSFENMGVDLIMPAGQAVRVRLVDYARKQVPALEEI